MLESSPERKLYRNETHGVGQGDLILQLDFGRKIVIEKVSHMLKVRTWGGAGVNNIFFMVLYP